MAFCTKCGNKLTEGARFCVHCGQPLMAAAPAPATIAVQPGTASRGHTLIKVYDIPENVRKQASKYTALELYTDRLVGLGSKNGTITYFFKNYMSVTWTPASIATQFAQIVFLTHENAGNYVSANNLNNLVDMNKIPFCSGMFSYAEANSYAKSLYLDIKAAMDAFKEQESNAAAGAVVQAPLSPADELKKYKELLDMGVITQAEFEAKKKQLLGL